MYSNLIQFTISRFEKEPLQAWEHLRALGIVPPISQPVNTAYFREPPVWVCRLSFSCDIVQPGATCSGFGRGSKAQAAKTQAASDALANLYALSSGRGGVAASPSSSLNGSDGSSSPIPPSMTIPSPSGSIISRGIDPVALNQPVVSPKERLPSLHCSYSDLIHSTVKRFQQEPLQAWEHLRTLGIVPLISQPVNTAYFREPPVWVCRLSFSCDIVQPGATCSGFGRGSKAQAAKTQAASEALANLCALSSDYGGVAAPLSSSPDSSHESSGSSRHSNATSPSCATSESSDIINPPIPAANRSTSPPPALALTNRQQRIVDACEKDFHILKDTTLKVNSGNATGIIIVALDVEKDEKGTAILEVGLTIFQPQMNAFYAEQIVVQDNAEIVNVEFCPSNKYDFEYGEVRIMALTDAMNHFKKILDAVRKSEGCLVGHSIHNDIGWLSREGVIFDDIHVCDIANVLKWVSKCHSSMGLHRMMSLYDVPSCGVPHNAGNDSVATFGIFRQQSLKATGIDLLALIKSPDADIPCNQEGAIDHHPPASE